MGIDASGVAPELPDVALGDDDDGDVCAVVVDSGKMVKIGSHVILCNKLNALVFQLPIIAVAPSTSLVEVRVGLF